MKAQRILVAGDLIMDFHIYQGKRYQLSDIVNLGVQVVAQPGGAALIHDLLESIEQSAAKAQQENQPDVEYDPLEIVLSKTVTSESVRIGEQSSRSAYAFWRPFAGPRKGDVWRVSEAMGFGANDNPPSPTVDSFPDSPEAAGEADVVVISEGGMGFRQSDDWKKLPLESASNIVLKTAAPLMTEELWSTVSKNHADKLTLIVSVGDLRKTSARISQGLSWDATVQDVVNGLQKGEPLAALTQCRNLIVVFGLEAALRIELQEGKCRRCSLVFDPGSIEGDNIRSTKGTAFGFQSCLTASVTSALAHSDQPDFEQAMEGGLSAMKNLLEKGHGPADEPAAGFPASRLAEVIRVPDHRFSWARFEVPEGKLPDSWSVLSESAKTSEDSHEMPIPYEMARLVAQRGPIALENLPSLKIGHLLSIDRHETESLRTLVNLIQNYKSNNPGKKPLSIGVFGPPGSGKSFGVTQIAQTICGKESWLEFNLSQFDSTADLIGSFHQIRDCALKGMLPVAFFDEFDSQKLRWLQYLLAPMQDGRFQEGQITHPIGKCIFIFAGGTSWTFDTFGPPTDADEEELESYRLAKGPDFKSRLDGFLDVIGPNQKKKLTWNGHGYEVSGIDQEDICFPIRRALMLRAELKCAPSAKLDMDGGLLNAILRAKEFKHGARSLSKILQPFQDGTSGPFFKSSLPPFAQIDMHTDAGEFLDQCETGEAYRRQLLTISGSAPLEDGPYSEEEVDVLARGIHDAYNKLTGNNYEYSSDTNEAAARRMIRNLELIGLRIERGTLSESERRWINRQIEYNLELLAEAEHDGWMKWHRERGWRYAPGKQKNKEQMTHPCLLPYDQLPLDEQEKDRHTIRTYVENLAEAGLKVVSFE